MLNQFIRSLLPVAAGVLLTLTNIVSTHAADKMSARYAVDGFVLGTLIRVAEDKGYFEEENIDATLLTFSYGVDTVDAVLAGQADFGVIIDMPLLTRLTSGKLSVPALIGTPNPGWHKLYVADTLQAPAGLKGKKIAVASGTAQEFVTRLYLEDNGLDPEKDVELVGFASLFEIIGAMKAGRADASWIWGQGVEQLGDNSGFSFVVDDSVVNQKTTALLVASKDVSDANPQLMAATLRALNKAGAVVENDIGDVAQIVADGISGDAAAIQPVISGQNYAISFETTAMQSLKAKYDFLVEQGVITEPYSFASQFGLETLRAAVPGADVIDSLE